MEENFESAGEERGAGDAPQPARSRNATPKDGDAPGPVAPGETAGATPAEEGDGPPKPKRRRGRRGGRRHRKPGTAPRATAATKEGAADASTEAPADGEGAEKKTRPAPRPRRAAASRPSGRTGGPARPRTPKPPTAKPAESEDAPAIIARPEDDGPVVRSAEADEPSTELPAMAEDGEGAAEALKPKRRRRRGGRGRGGKGRKPAAASDGDAAEEAEAPEDAAQPAAEPSDTAKAPAARGGSTRMEARAQRARQRPRRRPRRLSDEEAKRLRGSDKLMVIHEHGDRTQIAVLEGSALIEHFVAHGKGKSIAGNVYLGRVQNVLAGMEAAFVDIGKGRNAVLYAGEVNYAPEDLEGEAMPRIEKMLKPGQSVLVQVTKDPLGSKGARLTAQISLAGRYMVLAPEQQLSGISRRLAEDERARLRQILRSMRPNGHGVIVRTAAEGATAEALKRDLDNLVKIWDEIKSKQRKEKAPALLYAEPELVMRVTRDIFSGDFGKVVVDSKRIYETLRSYLEETGPDLLERLELYDGALPILEEYHVAEQIQKALERKVWLPSGGSIVIDRTEALTVIDVNTSKFVGKGGSLEETVFKNNLEAAEEVARQLRLRDIGGIIVIDFIDMIVASNREQVLRTLKRALGRDKTRSQVFDVSSLGLVEMTRKKVSEGLLEAFSEPCPNCEGRGIVITHEID